MSHYHLAVIIPPKGDVKELVSAALEPFKEDTLKLGDDDPRWFGLHWDWWRIGGRWDGAIKNLPECARCFADSSHHYEAVHEQPENNCVPIRELREDFHAWGVLEPDGTHTHRYNKVGSYESLSDGEWWPIQDKIINRWLEYRIVSVDYHN